MYTSEGAQASDFVADQGIYYHPVDPNYAYYCTGIYIFIMLSVLSSLIFFFNSGYESPGEWENHQMFFGIDGSQLQ